MRGDRFGSAMRRVGKATGSRECAPDDRLRVPTIEVATLDGGHGAHAPLPTLRNCDSVTPSLRATGAMTAEVALDETVQPYIVSDIAITSRASSFARSDSTSPTFMSSTR